MTLIKCNCMHCGGSIEFDEDAAGQETECPHCHRQTWIDLPGKMNSLPSHAKNKFRTAPPTMKQAPSKTNPCADCQGMISRRAVLCPHCGNIPSLWRVGWFTFCIMGVISLLTALIYALLAAANDILKSM